ncbi:MAG: Na(+)/H(+) antiporter subunit B [Bacteroidales bacterium]|nr:Na(+)/H(+) antiporter subunit B [Bacteroidales bacterium]
MLKKIFTAAVLGVFALILVNTYGFMGPDQQLNEVATRYAEKGPEEVGAANLVTAVIVTYRGLDTLGEVTILFLTASIIGFFLKTKKEDIQTPVNIRKTSEILETASKIITPMIFLLGVYVFINGHLTPGGGFQGGAIVASGLVLMLLANPLKTVNHKIITVVESLSGFFFVVLGVMGLLLAGGFLDNTFIAPGRFGTLFSAGAIPVIYIFIGLKVGSELSGIVSNMQETQKEEI